jgi:hypothetical protein
MIADSQPIRLDLEPGESSGHGALSFPRGFFSGVRLRLERFFENLVPLGYEDETGFHYGREIS